MIENKDNTQYNQYLQNWDEVETLIAQLRQEATKAWGVPNNQQSNMQDFIPFLSNVMGFVNNNNAEIWDQAYRQGIDDERTSEDNIGIAGYGMKVQPDRKNPFRITAKYGSILLVIKKFQILQPRPQGCQHHASQQGISDTETYYGINVTTTKPEILRPYGWSPIETAPLKGTICVAREFSPGRWVFNHAWFNPDTEEWTDEFGDHVLSPTHWTALPRDQPLPVKPEEV
jgi:hypothetical protein